MEVSAIAVRVPARRLIPSIRLSRIETAVIAAVLLLPLLLYLPFLHEPLEVDEGTYALIAQRMLHGNLPYRDLFDHKPPLVYVWYALSFLLMGENIVAPRVIAALVWGATALAVTVDGGLVWNRRTGLIAGGLFALSSALAPLQANANTELFMLLPLVVSLVCFTASRRTNSTRWLLLSGVAGGLAALTKQVAVMQLAMLAIWLLIEGARRRDLRSALRSVAVLSGGAIGVLALSLVPWIAGGGLHDFFYATVVYNEMYSGRLDVGDRLLNTRIGTTQFLMIAMPLVLPSLIAIAGALRRRQGDELLIVAGLMAAAAGVATSGFFFPHYFVALLPFVSLLAAPALVSVARRPVLAGALGCVLVVLSSPSIYGIVHIYGQPTPAARHEAKFPTSFGRRREGEAPQVVAAIRALTKPGDKIYNYGRETELYFLADRESPTRFVYDRPFWIDPPTLTEALRDLETEPPVLIIDSLPPNDRETWDAYHPPAVMTFLEAHYDFVAHVAYADLYLRRDRD